MGKRGQKNRGGSGSNGSKGGAGGGGGGESDLSSLMDELSMLSPQKRNELNGYVDQVLNLSSVSTPSQVSQLVDQCHEMYDLLQKISQLEMENMNRKIGGNRLKYCATFRDWILKNGGFIHESLIIQETGGLMGMGLKVQGESGIQYGEEVLKIPRKLMMSMETARDSSIGPLISRDPMLRTMNNVVLALHLLIEKNSPASFWEPYINVLPQRYDTVLYYKPQDFLELKGSPAFEDALKQYKFVARQYAYFYRKFQGTMLRDYFTYEEYRWAVSTVMTRQNQIPSLKSDDLENPENGLKVMINTLIPLWDMCNHEDGVISTDFDPDSDKSICMANRDFKDGEQFTIYYGVRANIDLLIHNGFVPETNKSDSLTLKLGISKKDVLYNEKSMLLEKLTVPVNGLYYLGNEPQKPIDGMIMAFLRVNSMTKKEEIQEWAKDESCRELLDVLDPQSSKNVTNDLDKKALNYIKIRSELLLRSYPTSVEDDKKILEDKELDSKKRFCVLLRMKEKIILQNTISYCTDKL